MTTPANEFDNQSQLPDFNMLRSNPDLLLRADVLHTVLNDPAQLVPKDDSGGPERPSAEVQESAQFAQELALSGIVRPEKAVKLAADIKSELDGSLREDIMLYEQALQSAEAGINRLRDGVQNFAGPIQVEDASRSIDALYSMIGSGADLRSVDWQSTVSNLRGFAQRYADGKRAIVGRQDETAQSVYGVVAVADRAEEHYVGPARRMYDQVNNERMYGAADDSILNGVISRGKPTIGSHQQECADEANTHIDQAEQTAIQVNNLYENSQQLLPHLRVFREAIDNELPYENTFGDQVGNISYAIEMMLAGNFESPSYALQRVEEAASTIMKIKRGAPYVDGAAERFMTTIAELRQGTQGLASSGTPSNW